MIRIAWNEVTDTAIIPEREPVAGEPHKYIIDAKRSGKKQYWPSPDTTETESQWCDIELERIKVSKMKIYRDEIIAYKSNLEGNLPTNGRPQRP